MITSTPNSTTTSGAIGFKALDDMLIKFGAARFGKDSLFAAAGPGANSGGAARDAQASRFVDQTVNHYAATSRQDAEDRFFGGFKPQQGTGDIRISIGLNMPPAAAPAPPPCFVPPTPPLPQPPSNPTHASTTMQNGRAVFENDNYLISAGHDTTVNITNKKTGSTYQASGDPHMSVNGNHAFDFWGTTSLALDDGTKVTFGTTDAGNGMTEAAKLTISNGDYGAEIKGIDNKPDSSPLAIQEYAGQGRALDAAVDDGVVLQENTAGNDLVTTDQNGHEFHVDQHYIDSVDEFKTQGKRSDNVDQFDSTGCDPRQLMFALQGGNADWAFSDPFGSAGGGSGGGSGFAANCLGDGSDWLKELEEVLQSQQQADAPPPPPRVQSPQHQSHPHSHPHPHPSFGGGNQINIGLALPSGLDSQIDLQINFSGGSAMNQRLWG